MVILYTPNVIAWEVCYMTCLSIKIKISLDDMCTWRRDNILQMSLMHYLTTSVTNGAGTGTLPENMNSASVSVGFVLPDL